MQRNPPSRIHVREVIVKFVVAQPGETTGPLYRLTFDLTESHQEIVGSLYFGEDYLKAQGFVDRDLVTKIDFTPRMKLPPGVTLEPEGEAPAECASRVAWHEERTCHWYDLR